MAYLKYLDLSLPKLNSEPNHWADHIEFFCFISQEGKISEAQITDRLLDENSNNPLVAVEDVAEEDEINELIGALSSTEYLIEDEVIDETNDNSAFRDKISSKINSYFNLLKARQLNFGDDYPFLVSNNDITLKENLTTSQTLYAILLCSSLLRLATKSGLNKLGHHFEELCGPAFKKLTPNDTQNIFFGSGSGENFLPSITGKFYDKVIELCNLLNVTPRTNFTEENAGIHNVGDGGLDWVGVFNFPDNQFSQPTFFGQCACGTDWISKEFDAHSSKWNKYIQFENGYLTYHFVPRHLRDESLNWYNPLDIYDVVLIDRYRLINLLKSEANLPNLITTTYKTFLKEIDLNKIDSFM
ncbi:MAG: hypothetical protein IPN93_08745 [Bacteroidetes bacterium]|nr:hypothetical protein [Bacteroidota bacterium]MBK9633180.1 hypothetical protein [Bacteroidota bacterium]MBL0077637.1 hypothetical protein [Bacteroidota bacterium]MBL0286469.1 hypothetical protein [Bacteroidota bacterium]MBP7256123.1 hypothetical protein [Chitinophagales bacterium]